MMKNQASPEVRASSRKDRAANRDTGIRMTSRIPSLRTATLRPLALLTLAFGLACSAPTSVAVPDSGSSDLPPGDQACARPLDAAQPFGGCAAQFGDVTWKGTFCPLSTGTVSEQTCAGYRLREFDLGTHGWRCFYDPTTEALVAGTFADDVPSFCDYQSSTQAFGSIPAAGACVGPLTALVDPCGSGGDGVCADPSVSLPSAPCAEGWYLNVDRVCSPSPPGQPTSCSAVGDGLCHLRCQIDGDCTDPCFPRCGTIYVFDGSDVGRPTSVCTRGASASR